MLILNRHFSCVFSCILWIFYLSGCSLLAPVEQPEPPPSQLIESNDLVDVTLAARKWGYALENTQVLVVYDLDNTLLAMEQDLGSDQWYYWQKELQTTDPCDPRVVSDRLAVQGALLYASAMRPTQDNASAIVNGLQILGFKSIILTSRGPDFSAMTFRELRRNDFDFRESAIGPPGAPALRFKPQSGSRETLYESGVYLTAGQHKGEMLKALLEKTATPFPRLIIMADDKKENLQDVLDTFAATETSVLAYRYGREDERVSAFDAQQAASEWEDVEPALLQLQQVFGPDNFSLPQPKLPEECEPAVP